MATTELGACEWFVWDLRRSNLIDRGQLDGVISDFLSRHPGAEPPALAEYLVDQGVLTQFQADRLLQGKTQGFVLGPYTLMDALGTGSMGTVYKATSKTDNKWYAVKVLPRRSMWNVRIARRKVRSFEQCRHPAVVPFSDVGTSGGMHYLAWPMIEGETLDKIVQRDGKLSSETACLYALQAAQGLEVCHAQGLFHGLLKPSNLMLGTDGQVRILDLGIGSLLAETEGESLVDTMSSANAMASGLDCASPESIMDPNNLTPIGDQYSLGCSLYYFLSGRYPFPEGTAVEKMMCHQTREPDPLGDLVSDLPQELIAVVERLMQKDPGNRYPSTSDVIGALIPFAGNVPSTRPPSRQVTRRPPAPGGDPARGERGSASSLTDTARNSARPTPPPGRPVPAPPPRQAPAAQPGAKGVAAPPGGKAAPAAAPNPAKASARPPLPSRDTVRTRGGRSSWEERLGPIGIGICALAACAIAWVVAWKFL